MLKLLKRTLILVFFTSLVSATTAFAQEVPTPPPAPLGSAQIQMPESARHLRQIWVGDHWERNKWVQGHYVYYKKYSPRSWVVGHWEYRPHRGIVRGWEWVSSHWQSGRNEEWGISPGMTPGNYPPGQIAPEPYHERHHHHEDRGGFRPGASPEIQPGTGAPAPITEQEHQPGSQNPEKSEGEPLGSTHPRD